jgi:exodeoxyribonuclease VII small subunit
MSDAPAKQSFEVSLERLEKIVHELESGSPALETSLELFAEGMELSEVCRAQLEAAEARVEILVRKGGKMDAEPFSAASSRTAAFDPPMERR